jgi:hypothetical protein
VLLLRRAVAGLKAAGHAVGLLAPDPAGAALRGPGGSSVDECLDWNDAALLPLFEEGADLEPLRGRLGGFDASIAYTDRPEIRAGLARLVPRVEPWPPRPTDGHAADHFARATRAFGAEPPGLPPDLEASAAEQREAEAFLGGRLDAGFLALHPGSGSPSKNWPAARFADLYRELGAGRALLVEGPADADAAGALAALPGVVRARGLTPRALGVLLGMSGLLVGNDSGVSHLAAAWGAPTLALFGPTDPAVWSPVGRRVHVLASPTGSMSGLTLDVVLAAARDVWTPGTAGA